MTRRPKSRRPSSPAAEHRSEAGKTGALAPLSAAVVTASDTRGAHDDPSGDLLAAGLAGAGVEVRQRAWVADDQRALEAAIRAALADGVDVVLVTGGTGPSPRDVTPEAVRAVCTRELPGFGELFRMLSYLEIGSAAVLSRATCGLVGRQAVYALPGSSAACALALERLVLPELFHLRAQLSRPAAPPS